MKALDTGLFGQKWFPRGNCSSICLGGEPVKCDILNTRDRTYFRS